MVCEVSQGYIERPYRPYMVASSTGKAKTSRSLGLLAKEGPYLKTNKQKNEMDSA